MSKRNDARPVASVSDSDTSSPSGSSPRPTCLHNTLLGNLPNICTICLPSPGNRRCPCPWPCCPTPDPLPASTRANPPPPLLPRLCTPTPLPSVLPASTRANPPPPFPCAPTPLPTLSRNQANTATQALACRAAPVSELNTPEITPPSSPLSQPSSPPPLAPPSLTDTDSSSDSETELPPINLRPSLLPLRETGRTSRDLDISFPSRLAPPAFGHALSLSHLPQTASAWEELLDQLQEPLQGREELPGPEFTSDQEEEPTR